MRQRLLLAAGSAAGLLVLLPVGAVAVELPVRKAGLWEMKVLSGGAQWQQGQQANYRTRHQK